MDFVDIDYERRIESKSEPLENAVNNIVRKHIR